MGDQRNLSREGGRRRNNYTQNENAMPMQGHIQKKARARPTQRHFRSTENYPRRESSGLCTYPLPTQRTINLVRVSEQQTSPARRCLPNLNQNGRRSRHRGLVHHRQVPTSSHTWALTSSTDTRHLIGLRPPPFPLRARAWSQQPAR